MNDKQLITVHEQSVFESISAAIGELACIIPLFLLLIPILFAPCFGFYIRGNRMSKYNTCMENHPNVKKDMLYVWIVLWIIAIIGWSFIVYTNIPDPHSGFQP